MSGAFKCAIKLTNSWRVSCTSEPARFTDCELPFGEMWKWILAKSYQREIFSCGDMSSDRLRRVFLYGISLPRANITSVYAARKDAKRTRAGIVTYGGIFRKWMQIRSCFNIIIYYTNMSVLKYIKIYARSICTMSACLWCKYLPIYKYQMFYASRYSSFDTYIFLRRMGWWSVTKG